MEVYKVTSVQDHAKVKAMVFAMNEEIVSQALFILNDIEEVEIIDENDKSCSYFLIKNSIDHSKMKEALELLNIESVVENITDKIRNWEMNEVMTEHKDVGKLFNKFIYHTSDMDDALERLSKVGQDNLEPIYKRIIKESQQ